jgi:hypothetical protein
MKIAIIDGLSQDNGLSILFPNADYFTNVSLNTLSNITDTVYDTLFIIISLYDTLPNTRFFKPNVKQILDIEINLINKNNFKTVCIFDNYDYDYDPASILNEPKITHYFKRNFNKMNQYSQNVYPFSFIMFGDVSIIEKITQIYTPAVIKHNRIFFTGTLFTHIDGNYVRDRKKIYNEIRPFIYNPGNLHYDAFLAELNMSKYALDLNGVGDPNKRTFEILSQGTLRIGEYNNLKWSFEEEFREETIFKNAHEFKQIIHNLTTNDLLYKECLEHQNYIYRKYFNKDWIKKYISIIIS